MSLSREVEESLSERGFSRRQLGRIAAIAAAGVSIPAFSEFAMAQQAERRMNRAASGRRRSMDPNAVRISSNENPLGPGKAGLEALIKVAPLGGRYSPTGESRDFTAAQAETEGLTTDHVRAYAGSSDALRASACAFSSPTRSWTMADPGYGGGAPEFIGSKTVRVPLTKDYAHDVKAMIKADPNAGAYYVCNPNNPSGTLTPREGIEYLLANKKDDAVVVVDEAYIHFSSAKPCTDLVKAGKDVVVLRTFSKAYGMAGLRAGAAIGRPDLLAKLRPFGGGSMLPITGMACGAASLRDSALIPERREYCKQVREDVFGFLDKKGIDFIRSESNFFMMTVDGMDGREVNQAIAEHGVYIGRTWAIWPERVRVSIGTPEEMAKFKSAFEKVLDAKAA